MKPVKVTILIDVPGYADSEDLVDDIENCLLDNDIEISDIYVEEIE